MAGCSKQTAQPETTAQQIPDTTQGTTPEAAPPEDTVPPESTPETQPEETQPPTASPETTPEATPETTQPAPTPEEPPQSTPPTESHTHKYTKTQVASTCVDSGYTLNSCSCGKSYKSDYIDPPGHSYGQWTVTKEPTASATGLEERICKTCSSRLTRVLNKLNSTHVCNYVATEVVKQPTCVRWGDMRMECSCGNYYTTGIENLGHDYRTTEYPGTCTEAAYREGICTRCGDDARWLVAEAPGHNWVETLVEPTCTTDGVKTTTCTRCGDTTKKVTSAKGHKMHRETCQSYAYCTVCGAQGEYLEHDVQMGSSCRYCRISWCELNGHLESASRIYCAIGSCSKILPKFEVMIQDILRQIITDNMTEFQKVKAIHDYIVNNAEYDYENYLNDTIPNSSYTARGFFENGMLVCDGYAYTFQVLCEYAGISCEHITGSVAAGLHAWNQVRIDGKWYNIDVCWDDPVSNRPILSYKYFLLSDGDFFKSHYTTDRLHSCDETYPADGFGRNVYY